MLSGLVCACLGLFGLVWVFEDLSRSVKAFSWRIIAFLACVGSSGLVWACVRSYGHVSACLGLSGFVLVCLVFSGLMLDCLGLYGLL
jgi:hypothetical protein